MVNQMLHINFVKSIITLLLYIKVIIFSDPYYVVDPANPFNNVMDACDCWDKVAEKARVFLRSPLFQGLSALNGWM